MSYQKKIMKLFHVWLFWSQKMVLHSTSNNTPLLPNGTASVWLYWRQLVTHSFKMPCFRVLLLSASRHNGKTLVSTRRSRMWKTGLRFLPLKWNYRRILWEICKEVQCKKHKAVMWVILLKSHPAAAAEAKVPADVFVTILNDTCDS